MNRRNWLVRVLGVIGGALGAVSTAKDTGLRRVFKEYMNGERRFARRVCAGESPRDAARTAGCRVPGDTECNLSAVDWIPVSERMPILSPWRWYLITSGGITFVALLESYRGDVRWVDLRSYNIAYKDEEEIHPKYKYVFEGVTHWAYMPKLPEDQILPEAWGLDLKRVPRT